MRVPLREIIRILVSLKYIPKLDTYWRHITQGSAIEMPQGRVLVVCIMVH